MGKKQGRSAASRRRRDQQSRQVTQSQSFADTGIKAALERIVAASDEELIKYLEAIKPEDLERISNLIVSPSLGEAEKLAHELAQRPYESSVIRQAAERLRDLFQNIQPKKIVVPATWLCATSGILTELAAPGTMNEINSQVTILGLGVAITVALNSNRKND